MNYIKKAIFIVVCVSLWYSCTDQFEKINTNSTDLSPLNPSTLNEALPAAMQWALPYSPNAWQFAVELTGSSWVGYTATPTPFGGSNNTNYGLRDDWNWAMWTDTYKVMSFVHQIKLAYTKAKDTTEKKIYQGMYALSLMVKVFAMHRLTDTYGPVIYTNFGTEKGSTYEKQSDVYQQFFLDLDEAIVALKTAKTKGLEFGQVDVSAYAGNVDKWIAFASSLRLRLAMRISKRDPILAQKEAEKAIKEGVIETVADNAVILDRSYKSLGLYTIFNDWEDSRMGAVIYSLLEGYKDPREEVYFTRVGAGNVPIRQDKVKPYAGKFLAIRGGIAIDNKASRTDYSSLGKEIGQTNRMVWMTAAETFFLRAEGAVKGWNMGGTAKDLYENGIRASFAQYSLPNVGTYLADATSKAVPYVDPMDTKNNVEASSPYLSTITIAWQEGDTKELKLERIITQKYLAMFPNGAEAWAEWRRTGYPKVFPVVVNNSNGVISTEDGVRRVNFSRQERQSINAGSVEEAVQLLKEESLDFKGDNGATRLWWDAPDK